MLFCGDNRQFFAQILAQQAHQKSISALGRRQSPAENAYNVSAGTCSRAQASITALADGTPAR